MAELHYLQYFVMSVYVLLGDNPDPALLNPWKKTKIQALRAKWLSVWKLMPLVIRSQCGGSACVFLTVRKILPIKLHRPLFQASESRYTAFFSDNKMKPLFIYFSIQELTIREGQLCSRSVFIQCRLPSSLSFSFPFPVPCMQFRNTSMRIMIT